MSHCSLLYSTSGYPWVRYRDGRGRKQNKTTLFFASMTGHLSFRTRNHVFLFGLHQITCFHVGEKKERIFFQKTKRSTRKGGFSGHVTALVAAPLICAVAHSATVASSAAGRAPRPAQHRNLCARLQRGLAASINKTLTAALAARGRSAHTAKAWVDVGLFITHRGGSN